MQGHYVDLAGVRFIPQGREALPALREHVVGQHLAAPALDHLLEGGLVVLALLAPGGLTERYQCRDIT